MFDLKKNQLAPDPQVEKPQGWRRFLPESLVPGKRCAVGVGGFLASLAAYNSLEAKYFDELENQRISSTSGRLDLKAEQFDLKVIDALAVLPDAIEHGLNALAKLDPVAADLNQHGLNLRVIPKEDWTQAQSVLCTLSADGAILINGEALCHLLKNNNSLDLKAEDRAALACAKLIPSIVSTWGIKVVASELNERNLPLQMLGTKEFLSIILAMEQSSYCFLFNNLDPHLRQELLSGRHFTSAVLSGWGSVDGLITPAGLIQSALSQYWGIPSAEQISKGELSLSEQLIVARYTKIALDRVGIENFSDPIPTSSSAETLKKVISDLRAEQTESCGAIQALHFEQSLEDLSNYLEGERAQTGTITYTASFQGLNGLDRSAQVAEHLGCFKLPLTSSGLALTHRALLDKLFDQTERQVESFTEEYNGEPRFSGHFDSYSVRKMIPALDQCVSNLPNQEQAPFQERLNKICQTLGRASLAQLGMGETGDRYTTLRDLVPFCQELIELTRDSAVLSKTFSSELELGLNSWRIQNGASYTPVALTKQLSASKSNLEPMLTLLTERERGWLSYLGIAHVDQMEHSRQAEHYMSPSNEDYIKFFENTWFNSLLPSAQSAICRGLVQPLNGEPRLSLTSRYPTQLSFILTEDVLRDIQALSTTLNKTPSLESSLLVEAFFCVPLAEREAINRSSSSDFSESDQRFLLLLGSSDRSPGPWRQAVQSLADKDPNYRDIDCEKLLRSSIPKALPNLFWPSNVSVMSSSATSEVSLNLIYANRVRDRVSRDHTLREAHLLASPSVRDFVLPISRPIMWLAHGFEFVLDGAAGQPDKPGYLHQNPQENIASTVTSSGPTDALIFFGKNNLSDIFMDFESDAEQWKDTLYNTYGTNCVVGPIPSADELKDLGRRIANRYREKGRYRELAIVITGHGSASELLGSEGSSLRGPAVHNNGSVGAFAELKFKKFVNEELAPHFDHISIIINSCHSGAWVE